MGKKSKVILIVEDEPAISDSISYALEIEGFFPVVATTGSEGLEKARETDPSLILLDVMLPGSSGLDLCREIRSYSDVPIIMLTARGDEADKVAGLELGADDYVTKPFSMRELMARVRTNVRRGERSVVWPDENEVLSGGLIELDIDAHEAKVNGEVVDLRPKEFDLLESLMLRMNRLSTRESLISDVWGPSYFGDTKTLDVHIKRLRHKLEADPAKPRQILTVRGLGYKFVEG